MIGNLFLAVSTALFSGILALGEYNASKVPQRVKDYPSSDTYRGDNILITGESEMAIQDLGQLNLDEYYYYNMNTGYNEINSNLFAIQDMQYYFENDTNVDFLLSLYYSSTYVEFIVFWNCDGYRYLTDNGYVTGYDNHSLMAMYDNGDGQGTSSDLSIDFGISFESNLGLNCFSEDDLLADLDNYSSYICFSFDNQYLDLCYCPFVFRINYTDIDTTPYVLSFKSYILVSSYDSYQTGYDAGYGKGYQDGYDIGKQDGNLIGYSDGYNQGYTDGLSMSQQGNFNSLFNSIADTPLRFLYGLFNFNLFGTSMIVIILSLLTGIVVIHLVKKFWK